MRTSVLYGLAAVVLAFAWQFETVTANYQGNWTALYCTGELRGTPASLDSEHIYTFPGSSGYDGQVYHYVAHDPLLRSEELKSYVDAPRLRYQRVLLPGFAYLLAAGHGAWIDVAYRTVLLAFIGLGAFWMAEYCRSAGRHMAWSLFFLLVPAVAVSIDRLTTDAVLAAFAVGLAVYWRTPSWKLFAVLTGAVLARETGFLLLAGYCLHQLIDRRWKVAATFSLSAAPALIWYTYVQTHTQPFDMTAAHPEARLIPMSMIFDVMLHPAHYTRLATLATTLDDAALIGMLLAFALALRWIVNGRIDPLTLAGALFAITGMFLVQWRDAWVHVYAYGRVFTPLVVFLAADGLAARRWLPLLPMALMIPRIGLELGPQIMGILGMAH